MSGQSLAVAPCFCPLKIKGFVPHNDGAENLGLHDLADEIKRTAFRVTRSGELIGRQVAQKLGIPFGIVDLSLAPTPNVGDSVG